MSKKVDLKSILEISEIFRDKNWIDREGYKEVIKRFYELMENLSPSEFQLILELLKRYKWLSFNDYQKYVYKLLSSLIKKDFFINVNKIFVFPIMKRGDEDKIKSGVTLLYDIKSITPYITGFEKIQVTLISKFEELDNLKLLDKEFLIVVDDYVGSGQTLEKTLEAIRENHSITNKYLIMSLIIQGETLEELKNKKHKILYSESVIKGITGYYKDEELENNLELMLRIEKNIPKCKNYSFGYEKSEALVTLKRIPNNTFPIFWKDFNKNGKLFKAPFPRY